MFLITYWRHDFWLHLVEELTKYAASNAILQYNNASINSTKDGKCFDITAAALKAFITLCIML
jgi:hypothetical protein